MQPATSLSAALTEVANFLGSDPRKAEGLASEILDRVPGQPQALTLFVGALRAQGRPADAFLALEAMAVKFPGLASVQYELGLLLGSRGDNNAAVAALSRAVELEPGHCAAWRALGDRLADAGDIAAAGNSYGRQFEASVGALQLLEDVAAFDDGQLDAAESMLREHLEACSTDISVLNMLGLVYLRMAQFEKAGQVLARILELAPSLKAERRNYAHVLLRLRKLEEANGQYDIFLEQYPDDTEVLGLKASVLLQIGEFQQAVECYERAVRGMPHEAKAWLDYAHALRTVGRRQDAIAAYRQSLSLRPDFGEAWWSLANLKTFRFSAEDIAAMRASLAGDLITDEDRYHLHFALGKALEDRAEYESSFHHYREGNSLRRADIRYNPDDMSDLVDCSRAFFTEGFFRAREGFGCPSPAPIFIVGLPRSGSTLVEQILSSHSQIEGTTELANLTMLATQLMGDAEATGIGYLEALALLRTEQLTLMGEEYLARTKIHRKLGLPHFTDKMPSNFHHLGFLHLILPNARIVDVRRHPLGCCFSNFKQHFAAGIAATYDLTDIGRYYSDYIALMAHFDTVLPERIHRVYYEALVTEPEREIRRLLDYCGLPFEENCLRFHQTGRAVSTVSSEQVRQPIYQDALDQWRHYEQWLTPLKAALGPVLKFYPGVPAFDE